MWQNILSLKDSEREVSFSTLPVSDYTLKRKEWPQMVSNMGYSQLFTVMASTDYCDHKTGFRITEVA